MTMAVNKKLEALDNELTGVMLAHIHSAKQNGQPMTKAELVGVLETIKFRIQYIGLVPNAEACDDSSNS